MAWRQSSSGSIISLRLNGSHTVACQTTLRFADLTTPIATQFSFFPPECADHAPGVRLTSRKIRAPSGTHYVGYAATLAPSLRRRDGEALRQPLRSQHMVHCLLKADSDCGCRSAAPSNPVSPGIGLSAPARPLTSAARRISQSSSICIGLDPQHRSGSLLLAGLYAPAFASHAVRTSSAHRLRRRQQRRQARRFC